jgi:hypothetical protein
VHCRAREQRSEAYYRTHEWAARARRARCVPFPTSLQRRWNASALQEFVERFDGAAERMNTTSLARLVARGVGPPFEV